MRYSKADRYDTIASALLKLYSNIFKPDLMSPMQTIKLQ